MSQQPSGPAGPGSDDWPDDLWPDEDDDGAHGDAWPAPSLPPARPGDDSPRRRLSPANLAVVAVVAVVIGAGIALAVEVFSGSPAASAPSSSQPLNPAPGQSGGNGQPGQGNGQPGQGNGQPGQGNGQPGQGNGQPGQGGQIGGLPGGGTGQTGHAFLIGTVLKLSATSTTIGGPGHTITAAVTSSTRVSGKVSAITGLKVGDQVSAQISDSGGKATVVAIQYPAQVPGGVPGG